MRMNQVKSMSLSFSEMVIFTVLLQNQCQGALKLFRQHVVAEHFTKTLCVGLSFNLLAVCICKDRYTHF